MTATEETIQPNVARIQLAVDALRSGNHKQGLGRLRTIYDTGVCDMCVLGVFCEVYREHEGGEWRGSTFHAKESCATTALPWDVAKWFGFSDSHPIIVYQGQKTRLSFLNDDMIGFDVLARLIEEQYIRGGEA